MTSTASSEPPVGGGPRAGADSGESLTGRDREAADIDRTLNDPDGPRIIFVVGERGAGRTVFLRAAARRHGAAGGAVLSVDCVPGDALRPYLLVLRLVKTLEQHRPSPYGPRRTGDPVAEMTAAVEQGDRAAAAEALTRALAHAAPAIVVVDDVQYADPASVDLLGGLDMTQAAPGVRLVLSLLRPGGVAGRREAPSGADAAGLLPVRHPAARVIEMAPLARGEVAALLAQRLQAVPDGALTGLVHETSRGLPAAIDILLAEWARHGEVLTAGRLALLYGGRLLPTAPRDNRFTEALRALGEPAEKVASGLSVLWPLGPAVCALIAEVYGLSAADVQAGLRELLDAGIVEELPVREDGATRGWRFRVPLTEYAVRERLGPLERGRLAAAAVQALWAAEDRTGGGDERGGWIVGAEPAAYLVAEADAGTYLPDRIVEAGPLIDPERAVTELVAATERMGRAPGRRFTLRSAHGCRAVGRQDRHPRRTAARTGHARPCGGRPPQRPGSRRGTAAVGRRARGPQRGVAPDRHQRAGRGDLRRGPLPGAVAHDRGALVVAARTAARGRRAGPRAGVALPGPVGGGRRCPRAVRSTVECGCGRRAAGGLPGHRRTGAGPPGEVPAQPHPAGDRRPERAGPADGDAGPGATAPQLRRPAGSGGPAGRPADDRRGDAGLCSVPVAPVGGPVGRGDGASALAAGERPSGRVQPGHPSLSRARHGATSGPRPDRCHPAADRRHPRRPGPTGRTPPPAGPCGGRGGAGARRPGGGRTGAAAWRGDRPDPRRGLRDRRTPGRAGRAARAGGGLSGCSGVRAAAGGDRGAD
ncbi:AAA family ATPase [Streptomyces griseorubiginosus]